MLQQKPLCRYGKIPKSQLSCSLLCKHARTHKHTRRLRREGGCISTSVFQYTSAKNRVRLTSPAAGKFWSPTLTRRETSSDKERQAKVAACLGSPRGLGGAVTPGGSGAGKHAWLGRLDWSAACDVHALRSSLWETCGRTEGFAKRWRPRNVCGESESPGGIPTAKTETGNRRFPGPQSKRSEERETARSTCTQRTPSIPAKLSASSAAGLLSRSPSSSPFLCLPPGPRLPCRGNSSHRWGHFLAQAPKPCPGLLPPFLARTYRCWSPFPY